MVRVLRKRKIEILSACYVSVIYGCIFFHVESWPFSDFRVFAGSSHPANMESLRLGVVVNGVDGPVWLFDKDHFAENEYVTSKFAHSYRKEDMREAVRKQIYDEFIPVVRKKFGDSYVRFALFGLTPEYDGNQMIGVKKSEILVVDGDVDAR